MNSRIMHRLWPNSVNTTQKPSLLNRCITKTMKHRKFSIKYRFNKDSGNPSGPLYICLPLLFSVLGVVTNISHAGNSFQPADPTCGGVVSNPNIATSQDYYNIFDREYLRKVEDRHLSAMEQHYRVGRWNPALDELSYVLNKVPNHPQALYRLIQLQGVYDGATKKFTESKIQCAIYWNESQPATRVLYGMYFHRMGDYDSAVEQYREALELNANHAEANYNLGLSLFKLGQYEQAAIHAGVARKNGYPLMGLKNMLDRQTATDTE